MALNLIHLILGTSGTGQLSGGQKSTRPHEGCPKLNTKQANTSATRTEKGGLHSKSHTNTRRLNHHKYILQSSRGEEQQHKQQKGKI